jgi:hypothetical protein
MAIRATCINKAGGYHENPYVAISHLGWVNESSAETGRSTRLEMFDWVRGGEAYGEAGTARARVITAVSPNGTKYVKTEADRAKADNLLKLPECR